MKKPEENKTEQEKFEATFLRDKKEGRTVSNHHKEYLGMDVPEDYFVQSKQSILDLVSKEKKETPVLYLRRPFQVAASTALLIALTIWYQMNSTISPSLEIASNDVLIESLFVEDTDMNEFVDAILVSEIVVEAEKSEQDLENVFINSLFINDSLVDDYAKESLLDNVVL